MISRQAYVVAPTRNVRPSCRTRAREQLARYQRSLTRLRARLAGPPELLSRGATVRPRIHVGRDAGKVTITLTWRQVEPPEPVDTIIDLTPNARIPRVGHERPTARIVLCQNVFAEICCTCGDCGPA